MRVRTWGWAWLAVLATPAARAQELRPAVVVQVAGSNIYLDIGSASGVRAGDTLLVQRRATGQARIAVAVVAASSRACMVQPTTSSNPFVQGDSLYIALPVAAAAPAATRPDSQPTPIRPPARVASVRSYGAVAFEASATRNIVTGQPAGNSDFASPGMRFRWNVENPDGRTGLSLNLTGARNMGPPDVFTRPTSVRVYDARLYKQFGNVAGMTAGRFLAPFDRLSGYWDGGMFRLGADRGLSVGIAGGFEPVRDAEEPSSGVRKYAAFAGFRTRSGAHSLSTNISLYRRLPQDSTPARTTGEWSQRVGLGFLQLGHDLETGLGPDGRWAVTRLRGRAWIQAGSHVELYGMANSDRSSVDLSFGAGLPRRERVNVGAGFHTTRFILGLDGSVESPRLAQRGYAGGVNLGLPNLVGPATLAASGSYFKFPGSGRGITLNPSIELRLPAGRIRGGYQYFGFRTPDLNTVTHGGELLLMLPISRQATWIAQFTARTGTTARTTSGYTSLELRF